MYSASLYMQYCYPFSRNAFFSILCHSFLYETLDHATITFLIHSCRTEVYQYSPVPNKLDIEIVYARVCSSFDVFHRPPF